MLALLAQVFAFHAGWGAPPPPPPRHAIVSPRRAVAEALDYCWDQGFFCRPDGVHLAPGDVWRVRLDAGRKHRRGEMVVDVDGCSGAVLGARGGPFLARRWDDGGWRRGRWHW